MLEVLFLLDFYFEIAVGTVELLEEPHIETFWMEDMKARGYFFYHLPEKELFKTDGALAIFSDFVRQ